MIFLIDFFVGLRIAPPEAPKSGYRFGKGIYAADAIAKSAVYCRSGTNQSILVMACEIACGNQYEAMRDQYMEKPQTVRFFFFFFTISPPRFCLGLIVDI